MNIEEKKKFQRYDRALAVLHWIGLGLILLFALFSEFERNKEGVYVYLAAGILFTLVYHHLAPKRFIGPRKLILESYVDIFGIALLMFLTGGHNSIFLFYYFLVVAGSALIFGRRRVFLETILISFLLLALFGVGYQLRTGVSQKLFPDLVRLIILLSSLWIVAFWSGSLASIVARVLEEEKVLAAKNRELYERELKARRELVTIQKTSATLLSNRNLDQVLREITEGLTNGVGYDRAAIFLINKEKRVVEGKYASGLSPELTRETKISLLEGKGMLFASIWQAKPFIVKSLFESLRITEKLKFLQPDWSPRLATVPVVSRTEQGQCAEIIKCGNSECPLFNPEPEQPEVLSSSQPKELKQATQQRIVQALDCPKFKVFGALVVDNFKSKKPITKENLAALQIFAQNAAIAIENATLFKGKEERATHHYP